MIGLLRKIYCGAILIAVLLLTLGSAMANGRARPEIAIIAENEGTEASDFMVPYGVLKESNAANVVTVSMSRGPVKMWPSTLEIEADMTAEQYEASFPAGADVVIVPAVHDDKNPALIEWVRKQAQQGARVVSICDGAWVLARAGLLQGKRATTHWYSLSRIEREFADTKWVRDERYVVDGSVMTTTGVSAAVPASLALVEAIAGHSVAEETATKLGVSSWSTDHESNQFHLGVGRYLLAAGNLLAFWNHETVELPIENGVDELALALTADGWSRTYRSSAVATNERGSVLSRRGLRIRTEKELGSKQLRVELTSVAPAQALDSVLDDIQTRYGQRTSEFVSTQFEYKP